MSAPYNLILLRHGQSLWNEQNLFTGWVDVRLTEKGRAEAARAPRPLARDTTVQAPGMYACVSTPHGPRDARGGSVGRS